MDYGNERLADLLAAEYSLGTMRGGARRRMERLLPAHPALQRAVSRWDEALAQLNGPVAPVRPPATVWSGISRQLFGVPEAPPPWWRRLGVWQGLTGVLATGALAAALVLPQALAPTEVAPVVIVLNAATVPAGQPALAFAASYVPDSQVLVIRPVDAARIAQDRALELWALPPGGAPRSLGLIGKAQATRVQGRISLQGIEALAVSIEPAGGAPKGQPTGPIVAVGPLQL